MCGIFGILIGKGSSLTLKSLRATVSDAFKLSESRGKEASGMAVRTGRSIYVLKEPVAATKLIKSKELKNIFDNLIKCEGYADENLEAPFAILGHSRLVTNGQSELNSNNQPVIKDGAVGIHNGIIVNDSDLWKSFPVLKKEYDVDTEVFLGLLQMFRREDRSVINAAKDTFNHIQGSASVAVTFDDTDLILLATNTGSLYACLSKDEKLLVFASEKYILKKLVNSRSISSSFDPDMIFQVKAGKGYVVNLLSMGCEEFTLYENRIELGISSKLKIDEIPVQVASGASLNMDHCVIKKDLRQAVNVVNIAGIKHKGFTLNENKIELSISPKLKINEIPINVATNASSSTDCYIIKKSIKQAMIETWERLYSGEINLRRCTKCLLPETMPYIHFDDKGVCNYCRNFENRGGNNLKGGDALKERVAKYKSPNGEPDCIVGFSGGRDSTYGLDYIKNVLGLNPITFTYDWGMVVDLARRNQARVCGKLGIENIVVSADIKEKRENIRKNLEAWLKKPELGMVPLLMAGDKQFYYYFHKIREQTGVKLFIFCGGHEIEETAFKYGFCGLDHGVNNVMNRLTGISANNKVKLILYYIKQYLRNPAYINKSMLDTLFAYYSTYILPDDYLYLYHYIEWDEKKIISGICEKFDWELASDTVATWRTDDGTAAFYNYIYMAIAGFTEFDNFRSYQIREGKLTRDEAFEIVKEENKPRFEAIEWYAQAVGFDCNRAINIINSVPKLYLKSV